eukprot:6148497-Alexandrium_andersonii.AAC.1
MNFQSLLALGWPGLALAIVSVASSCGSANAGRPPTQIASQGSQMPNADLLRCWCALLPCASRATVATQLSPRSSVQETPLQLI